MNYTQSKQVSNEQLKQLISLGLDCTDVPVYWKTIVIPTIPEAIRWCADKLQVYAFVGKWFVPRIRYYGYNHHIDEKLDTQDYDCYENAEIALLNKLIELLEEHSNLKIK